MGYYPFDWDYQRFEIENEFMVFYSLRLFFGGLTCGGGGMVKIFFRGSFYLG